MRNVYNYRDFESLKDLEFAPSPAVEKKVSDTKNSDDVLLDVVYAPHPITGLPCGDIQQFMSKNISPEVREYINTRLMRQTPRASLPDVELSDDELAALEPAPNENSFDYVQRVTKLAESWKSKDKKDDDNKS